MKKVECVLEEMGGNCSGDLKDRQWFGQLSAPICDSHYRANLIILALYKNDIDRDTFLSMTIQEREDRLNELSEKTGKSIETLLDEAYKYEQSFKS